MFSTRDDAGLASVLAHNAGQLAFALHSEKLTKEYKSSACDIVTEADRAAEKHIVGELTKSRAQDGIIGEEGSTRPSESGRTWVIDPVDGTYNFMAGSPYWCSAIALRRDGGPEQSEHEDNPDVILGAVYQPTEEKLWVGGEGIPTTVNGEPIQVNDVPLGEASLGTYMHPEAMLVDAQREAWLRAASKAGVIRMPGSASCDLARVAQGQLDCWLHGSLALWDWLPGKALVEAAGGVTDVVTIDEHRWHLAGSERAVSQLRTALIISH